MFPRLCAKWWPRVANVSMFSAPAVEVSEEGSSPKAQDPQECSAEMTSPRAQDPLVLYAHLKQREGCEGRRLGDLRLLVLGFPRNPKWPKSRHLEETCPRHAEGAE